MRLSRFLFAVVILTLGLTACAVPVRTEYVHRVNYLNYHTFAWLEPPPQAMRNPLLQSGIIVGRIKHAVVTILTDRGYRYVRRPAQASFLVTLHLVPYRKIVSRPGFGYGFFYGYYDFFGPFFGPGNVVLVNNSNVSAHRRGYIVLDVIDGRTRKLVWRGWLSRSLHRHNFTRRAIFHSIARILKHFPPPGG